MWQWCADAYEGKDFRLEAEPTGTKPGPLKILRGGAWMSLRRHFESDYLYYDKPFLRLATYGFRCAKDVELVVICALPSNSLGYFTETPYNRKSWHGARAFWSWCMVGAKCNLDTDKILTPKVA